MAMPTIWSGKSCRRWGNAIPEYIESQTGLARSDGLRGAGTEGEEVVDLMESARRRYASDSALFCC